MSASENGAWTPTFQSVHHSGPLLPSDNLQPQSALGFLSCGNCPAASQPTATLPSRDELRACLVKFIPSLAAILHRRFTHDVAEEAIQDALAVALAYIESGKAAQLPNRKAWLVRVAINKANAILRLQQSISHLGDPDALPDLPDRREWFQICAALLSALAALPHDERVVLEQLYFSGLSERKAAKAIGIPHSTLRRRHAIALASVRTTLEQSEEFGGANFPLAH